MWLLFYWALNRSPLFSNREVLFRLLAEMLWLPARPFWPAPLSHRDSSVANTQRAVFCSPCEETGIKTMEHEPVKKKRIFQSKINTPLSAIEKHRVLMRSISFLASLIRIRENAISHKYFSFKRACTLFRIVLHLSRLTIIWLGSAWQRLCWHWVIFIHFIDREFSKLSWILGVKKWSK